jgi:hypothetical protein
VQPQRPRRCWADLTDDTDDDDIDNN